MDFGTAHFGHVKLVVDDLDASAAFYRDVLGLTETGRVDASMDGKMGTEVMFAPTSEGGAMLALVHFHDTAAPAPSGVLVGFMSNDLESLCGQIAAAGGSVTQPIRSIPEHGVKAAFATDPEGNVLELLELL